MTHESQSSFIDALATDKTKWNPIRTTRTSRRRVTDDRALLTGYTERSQLIKKVRNPELRNRRVVRGWLQWWLVEIRTDAISLCISSRGTMGNRNHMYCSRFVSTRQGSPEDQSETLNTRSLIGPLEKLSMRGWKAFPVEIYARTVIIGLRLGL